MLITKISSLSGRKNTMELDVTQEQLDLYAEGVEKVQDVFPNLKASEREFIKTGITPNEWDGLFWED
jgi:hypothetical protein